jgi:hypothetical protein
VFSATCFGELKFTIVTTLGYMTHEVTDFIFKYYPKLLTFFIFRRSSNSSELQDNFRYYPRTFLEAPMKT